jgi:hypothetical protein
VGPTPRSRPHHSSSPRRALIAALAAAVLAGCGEPSVLEVGRVGFTAEDLGVLGESQRRTLADLAAFGLAVADGRLAELAEPFVARELRSVVLQRLAMEVAIDDAGMDDDALREAYRANPRPELVVRHLVVLSERWRPAAHRDSARERAEEALSRARAGESFTAVVREYSDEPGAAERGGLLEPGREGSWVPEFWRAASALEEGEITDVVETEYGFHVIRLEERRAVPFDEVRESVLQDFVDLPRALQHANDWATEQADEGAVDTAAATAWARGDTTTRTLVTWPGDSGADPFRTVDLDRLVSTLSPAEADAIRAMDPAGRADFVRSAARNEVLLSRAAERGIEASAAQRVALERRWANRLAGWGAALGFQAGMSDETVKAAALRALGDTRQEVAIARSELETVSVRLRELYDVRRIEEEDGEG